MSAIGSDAAERLAIDNVNIDPISYFKEVLGNRVYYVAEAPRLLAETVVSGLKGMGFMVSTSLVTFAKTLDKVVKTENLIFFVQDVLDLPSQVKTLAGRTVAWWKGSISLASFANQGRKFVGHIGSTVGDYVDSCSALHNLKILGPNSGLFDKIGNLGSAIGAASRITDYAMEDTAARPKHQIVPQMEQMRATIAGSRALWNLTKDVSILALSVMCLSVGFGALPAIFSVGLPATILGARMSAYYKELQLKAIDASYAQMAAAKQLVKV